MDNITRPLILLPGIPESLPFTSKSSNAKGLVYPDRDRIIHGQWLQQKFEEIWQQSNSSREERIAASIPAKNGVYIEFAGQAGSPLKVQSLEDIQAGIRLLNIQEKVVSGQLVKFATVYVPSDKRGVFLKKFSDYTLVNTINEHPKNQDLARGIEQMRRALLDSFWVDSTELMPSDTSVWCEVWLRFILNQDQATLLDQFYKICSQSGIQFKNQKISFPERLVTLICANQHQLGELIESFDFIAEIRRAQEPESFWTSQYNSEQVEWVDDLLSRLVINSSSNVYISIFDTGVNKGHPLISPVLSDQDCHTVMPEWHLNDYKGHGTLMAGICAFGDLKLALESRSSVDVLSLLESIKILPDHDVNDPDLYGYITSQGVSLAEIQNPQAKRIICMAVTSAFQTDKGRPSSWSASIDALSSGADDNQKRLFIISAGNVRNNEDFMNYPESNRQISVGSPAQSWNALTVGAYTRKSILDDDQYTGYNLLASANSLSPFSTTSLSWETKIWPNKPDVIFEGGNLLISPEGEIDFHDDLSELTTFHQIFRKHFSTIHGTSLATAKAAWMAASIQFHYPDFWPETIRGLMAHSAEWPDELLNQFGLDRNRKTDVSQILRIAGYGLPDLNKAIQCASNSLTLIAQNSIQPFIKEGVSYKTNQMHLYRLPWPVEELVGLGPIQVKLRITLSFYIEPGPGEIGWKNRYRYASHGLRFDLNNTNETEQDFIRRLNAAVNLEEDENMSVGGTSGAERWQIGINNRKQGSLHSDVWTGNAADLALCNIIGIYPIIGWWRERHNQECFNKQTRYSLIVSLEVPEQDIDIYTTVRNMIAIPIVIQV